MHGLVLTISCCFWGFDFGHGQAVSSLLLLNAVLSDASFADSVFCSGVVDVDGHRRQPVSSFLPCAALVSYAWLGADCFVLFWVDFGHGQVGSSVLLLNAVLSTYSPLTVFVPLVSASMGTFDRV